MTPVPTASLLCRLGRPDTVVSTPSSAGVGFLAFRATPVVDDRATGSAGTSARLTATSARGIFYVKASRHKSGTT